ncbi:uracil-DNA glycosylase [Leptolyngbya sp. 7M]|uniref:uracil-DNA glycosylase n=1 Tax=Leptolyngbya sp. 7M TaxID=2812896 RepID=UPI001B8B7FE8|nr:uracil-DNA glycosylase [Leptolyngbya sp. 7M]QYO66296.1 uracil-DNA glycosylase [Leptolyngbya sp. 7M]
MGLSKPKLFATLCNEAQACRICPELADKTAVLSKYNGILEPRVMFIAEAPGRQGADRTRRPFYGDKSGENFQVLLDSIGLTRDEIFITNAVMCSPRTATDANRKPTRREIKNCSAFLRRTVELIDSPIIATLGGVALDAIRSIEPHSLKLATDVGRPIRWFGRTLVPLYHPSPQVIAAQRGLGLQLKHFERLAELI